jgi:hypothetical protein
MEIAAPVFDSLGVIIGALSILGPEMRLAGARLENELIPLLCQSAVRLSISLGYCPTTTARAESIQSVPMLKKKARKLEPTPYACGGVKSCC